MSGLNYISDLIDSYKSAITSQNIPLHSLLLLNNDDIVYESYIDPHYCGEPHNMYSIAKSMVSIAVGLLIDEHRLDLDDRIVNFFPEYVKDAHPWITDMTIRDMLSMKTCHCKTTYKADLSKNWVESFFITPPHHAPGTVFNYDTSSAHVLGALVEKITGEKLFDYMRRKLAPLKFSDMAHMTDDPFGVSDGGSGLVCTSRDLAEFARLIIGNGNVSGKQLISAQYLRDAFSCHADITSSGITPGRATGYGYMFWISETGDPFCFGMNGQFIIFCPEKNYTFIATTGQSDKSAPGIILDTFYDMIYHKL